MYRSLIEFEKELAKLTKDARCSRCHHTVQQHDDNEGNCDCCNSGAKNAITSGYFSETQPRTRAR